MPIIKRAIKKMRQDKVRTAENAKKKRRVREAVKAARKKTTEKNLNTLYSVLDKAVKSRIIHKNKAARIKSRLTGKK